MTFVHLLRGAFAAAFRSTSVICSLRSGQEVSSAGRTSRRLQARDRRAGRGRGRRAGAGDRRAGQGSSTRSASWRRRSPRTGRGRAPGPRAGARPRRPRFEHQVGELAPGDRSRPPALGRSAAAIVELEVLADQGDVAGASRGSSRWSAARARPVRPPSPGPRAARASPLTGVARPERRRRQRRSSRLRELDPGGGGNALRATATAVS